VRAKRKQCSIGASCGGSCVSKDKKCKTDLTPAQKNAVGAAVKKLGKVARKLNPTRQIFKIPDGAKVLGQGAFGQVIEINPSVLVKTSRNPGLFGDNAKQLQREAKLQNRAAKLGVAPPVISYSDVAIKMRRAKGELLEDFLESAGKKETMEMSVARAAAITKLHKAGIAHNDLKDNNEFWDPKSKTHSFIDFGLATTSPKDIFYEYQRNKLWDDKKDLKTPEEYTAWLKTQ
jgi:predicted Ser/Thr protein kinase